MEYFRCKTGLVAGEHVTEPTSTITYVIVVSRETVIISLVMAALNELPVKVEDNHNAYITAPVTENIWTFLY